MEGHDQEWAELLLLSKMSTIALAHMTLRIMEDPKLSTPAARDELVEMIKELEYGVARFEEYIV